MTLKEAYLHTKGKKANIQPNRGFMAQLLEFEKSLFGQTSFDIESYMVDVLMSMGFDEGKFLSAVRLILQGKSKRALEISGLNFELAVSALLMGSV
jgi:hypothetical protein